MRCLLSLHFASSVSKVKYYSSSSADSGTQGCGDLFIKLLSCSESGKKEMNVITISPALGCIMGGVINVKNTLSVIIYAASLIGQTKLREFKR